MAVYYIYPGDKVLVRCSCGELVAMIVPSMCPDCQVKREGVLDQAEDFDCPDWLARQARRHPAQVVKNASVPK